MLESLKNSGQVNGPDEAPRKGVRIRDYELTDGNGGAVHFSDFRGRKNLVIVDESAWHGPEYAKLEAELEQLEAVVLIIGKVAGQTRGGVLRVANPNGAASRMIAGKMIVTDRFGEVFAIYKAPVEQGEIVAQLEFINNQCPECEPPEWIV